MQGISSAAFLVLFGGVRAATTAVLTPLDILAVILGALISYLVLYKIPGEG